MTTVKQIVDECGDVARDRWRFYYERAREGASVDAAKSDADTSLVAEYERGVLIPSKQTTAVRKACVIAEGVFVHASDTGEIDPKVMAKFVAEFAKIKRDLP